MKAKRKKCELCLVESGLLVRALCPQCRYLALKVYSNSDDALRIVLWAVRRARMFEVRSKFADRATDAIISGFASGLISSLVGSMTVETHAHVPIAEAITSRSRALLSNSLATAMGQGRIYYADTDSVVTTSLMPTSPKDEGVETKPTAKGLKGLAVDGPIPYRPTVPADGKGGSR